MRPTVPRKKLRTVTRNSVKWKIVADHRPQADVLSIADIEELSSQHQISEELINNASKKLRMALRRELSLIQPEIAPARRKAGQKKLAQIVDQTRAAKDKLRKASNSLLDLEFDTLFLHMHGENMGENIRRKLDDAILALEECSRYFMAMEKTEMVSARAIPDARKVRDVRREIVCATLFNLWLDVDRKVSYSTDPVSGERTGPLIEFINDVVVRLTDPPARLSGEAIKREIENFNRFE